LEEKDKSVGGKSLLSKLLDTAGSVKFGIVLLMLIVMASLLGMVVRQHNVAGFDTYIAELGDFQRVLFSLLGLFDIYHSWYFNLLLALLSLNIVLASIERFPNTLRFIRNPNIEPSAASLERHDFHWVAHAELPRDECQRRAAAACRKNGFRKVIETASAGRSCLFAEKGAWNRLGAYPVHVALLTILFGGLLSSFFGFTAEMPLSQGQTTDEITSTVFRDDRAMPLVRKLPFTVRCTDLQQKLIDPLGSIEVKNSLDWITRLGITDEFGTRSAAVRLNQPFDYRGYRFFHSSSLPIGKARSVLIRAAEDDGPAKDIRLRLNETASLANGYRIKFIDFRSNLNLERREVNENPTTYPHPAAILEITAPDGSRRTAYAFRKKRNTDETSLNTFQGLSLRLLDFERVSERHVLMVQYDPGSVVLYAGFALLLLSLAAVFFFSHRRIWIVIEDETPGRVRITFAGDTNRNYEGFEKKFRKIAAEAGG
jgi:cytochrome c biogenesis protein